MKTARTHHDDLLENLRNKGFILGRWDSPTCRILDRKNQAGRVDLRVVIHRDEAHPQTVSFHKYCGSSASVNQWDSTLSADMPLDAILALVSAL